MSSMPIRAGSLVLLTALAQGAARADDAPPELRLVGAFGDCVLGGNVAVTASPGSGALLTYADLSAQATAAADGNERTCTLRLATSVPPFFQLALPQLTVGGSVAVAAGGDAGATVRLFATGADSLVWYRDFDAPGAVVVDEASRWPPRWLPCGASPDLNVLVDLTATGLPAVPATTAVWVKTVRLAPLLYKRCDQTPRLSP